MGYQRDSRLSFLSRPKVLEKKYTAINCSLFPTINTDSASINHSTLEEKTIDTFSLRTVVAQLSEYPTEDLSVTGEHDVR